MAKRPSKSDTVTDPLAEAEERAARLEAAVAREEKAQRKLARLQGQSAEEQIREEITDALPGSAVIGKIMADLNGEGSFWVYKDQDGGGKAVKIGSYDLTEDWETILDSIVAKKGGGNYTIRFRDSDGAVVKAITRTFDPVTAPTLGAAAPANDLMTLFASMNKASEDRAARLETALENSRLEMARIQSENTKAMFEMVKAQNSGGFLKEIAPHLPMLMKALEFLRPAEKNPLDEIGNVLDIMDALKDKNAEPSGTWDKIGSVIAQAIAPATAAALGAGLGARRRPAGPPPVKPLPTGTEPKTITASTAADTVAPGETTAAAPTPAPAVIPSAETSGEGKKVIPLGPFIDNCLTAINSGQSPEAAAEYIFNGAENRGQQDVLRMMVEMGDWESLKTDPRLAPHQDWIARLRAKLSSLIEEGDLADSGVED